MCPRLLSAVLALAALSPAPAADGLQPNDFLAICGDSITEQKLYSVFIENYLLMCQPQPGLQAMQAGWGGETAGGFAQRVAKDVLPFKPTAATTFYGMNDGGYAPLTPERATRYRVATQAIVDTLRKGGVRFIVVGGPGVVDVDTYKGPGPAVYNQTLSELNAIAREVAEKNSLPFADVHAAMLSAMTAAKAKYGPAYHVAGGDGIHPAPNGHLVIAYAFLKALGCDGNIGTITVDMKNGQATATDGHKVVSAKGGAVEMESSRYPFCFSGDPSSPASTLGMAEFIPFNQDLNRFLLVVKNPGAPKLTVTWGEVTKEFPGEALAKGINLAAEFPENPFSQPFRNVEKAVRKQQDFETPATKVLLHGLPEWRKHLPESAAQFDALQTAVLEKDAGLRAASRAAVVPVKHTLTIAPAG